MTTLERAIHLARAAAQFPFLGETSAESLLALIDSELSHPEALDIFVPRGSHLARAVAPRAILHIISGNTPAAGLQSLIRGLLLGSRNFCKIPTEGLKELLYFQIALPVALADLIEISRELPGHWLDQADAVVTFGSDSTIAHFRALTRPDQIFIAHGHRLSFGMLFSDPEFARVQAAVADAIAFDQLGCLSPHVFYFVGDARNCAARFAIEMQRAEEREPRESVSLSTSNAIRARREELDFRAANGEPIAVWTSSGSTAWTVVFDETPGFPETPLHRFLYVKPLPADFTAEFAAVRPYLSCVGIWPATLENAQIVATSGVSRICPIGSMQMPPWTWHPDGQPAIGNLVRWIDAELT